METIKRVSLIATAVCLWAGNAWAQHPGHGYGGHSHGAVQFGFYVGAPAIYPPPVVYWPRVYYAPPVVAPTIVTQPPPVYIEQQQAVAAVPTLEPGFWYYCNEAQAYFPYVKQCPGAWQKVVPQPPQ